MQCKGCLVFSKYILSPNILSVLMLFLNTLQPSSYTSTCSLKHQKNYGCYPRHSFRKGHFECYDCCSQSSEMESQGVLSVSLSSLLSSLFSVVIIVCLCLLLSVFKFVSVIVFLLVEQFVLVWFGLSAGLEDDVCEKVGGPQEKRMEEQKNFTFHL